MVNYLHNKVQSSLLFTVAVAVLVTAVVYIYFILRVPQFLADDYYIFHTINNNPSSPVSLNFTEKYSLALRPVTYSYFWLQFHFFGTDALFMKCFSLILVLGYSAATIVALRYILDFFEKQVSKVLLLIGGLFISLHPDTVISVLWISNVNELLMSLLYVLAVIVFFAFVKNDLRSSVYAASSLILFYLLSIFAKQQSLHLPVLFLFLLIVYKHKFERGKYSTLFTTALVMCLFLFVSAILNTMLYYKLSDDSWVSVLHGLIKKPVALLGNIFIIFFPKQGIEIYDYFIRHKFIAGVLFVIGMLAGIILMRRKKSIVLPVVQITAVILIASFPRMMAPGGDRLNTVLVFLMVALLLVLVSRFQKSMLLIASILMVNVVYSSIEKMLIFERTITRHAVLCKSLSTFDDNSGKIKFLSYFSAEIPTSNSFYFYKHGDFGQDSLVIQSGIVACDYRDWLKSPQNISSVLNNDTLTVSSSSEETDIHWDRDFHPVIVRKETGNVRGFSRIGILISDSIDRQRTIFLAPHDTMWTVLR
jgi:hypothetical protein